MKNVYAAYAELFVIVMTCVMMVIFAKIEFADKAVVTTILVVMTKLA